jgi:hypothetical protein
MKPYERRAAGAYPYFRLARWDDRNQSYRQLPGVFEKPEQAQQAAACNKLHYNRFAAWVVGDFRDDNGNYRNFPGLTVDAFKAAGVELYNEAILVTAVGSLPLRVNGQFTNSRKLGKTHQNVFVFIKGSAVGAARICETVI